jgi:hypothetical protein
MSTGHLSHRTTHNPEQFTSQKPDTSLQFFFFLNPIQAPPPSLLLKPAIHFLNTTLGGYPKTSIFSIEPQ